AVALQAWHDTELDVECRFMETESGEYHCLPAKTGGWHFSDPDCTLPVITAPDEYTSGELVTRTFRKTCDEPMASAWEVGDTQPLGQTYIVTGGGTCSESLANPDGRPLTAVADEDFVEATARVIGDGPVRGVLLEGDDGSHQIWALADDDGDRCQTLTVGETLRCVSEPLPGLGGGFYEDDDCMVRLGALRFGGSAVCPDRDPRSEE